MGKYFGTDGIRGQANERLTPELALKVGQYLGAEFKGKKIVIGQDTRLSSSMFESALAAGITAMGADVYLLGVCATPALAYIVRTQGFAAGVMISASHNPYEDNGLKCFSQEGMKIDATLEDAIEAFIDGEVTLDYAHAAEIGEVHNYNDGLAIYKEYIESVVNNRFDGLKIVLDLAHGSAVSSAVEVFATLGAEVIMMNGAPNGTNINVDCGSTHPESLEKRVVAEGAHLGFAFDGDADRCLAVDHTGALIDGDKILYILGRYMMNEGSLKANTIVSTVMANLGFMKSAESIGLTIKTTSVGDKYVFQEMVTNDYKLGGEQSGHIILMDYATTGDGVMTALKLTEVIIMSGQTLHELAKDCDRFPQLLKNVPVDSKEKFMKHPEIKKKIDDITSVLGDDGRILVRPSGTEELVRVMVEARTNELCERYVNDMIRVIETIEL